MKKLLFFLSILFFGFVGNETDHWYMPEQHVVASTNLGAIPKLFVFYLPDNQLFINDVLPKIKKYCAERNIEIIEKKVSEGMPSELTSLPALVFQNDKGRSIYAARYTEFSSIENFIRTSRSFAQQAALNCKKNVLVHQNGRMKVVAALKITPIAGSMSNDFNVTAFEENAAKSIDEAMQTFGTEKEVCLQKTDRVFYIDIHPYADKNGKLFLSYELYSQFSCTQPIFSKIKTPLEGNLSEPSQLFSELGRVFETEILTQLKNSTIGDAYLGVANNIPEKTWTALGMDDIKNASIGNDNENLKNKKLGLSWTYAGAIDSETPAMAFHFQEPLDRYAGEVKTIRGGMQLNDNQQLTQGSFEVNTESLTMGIADFDHKIHDKYIRTKRFPTATFFFKNQNIELAFGKTTAANVIGEFTLMGKKIPLTIQAQLTPNIGSKGESLIAVQGTFSINILDDFGIKGPDGPDPAKKTMQFFLNFFCVQNP
jgi:polyisoprenoid-binding protein YceI